MSTASTHPACGRTSYSRAERPAGPARCPTWRRRPARSRLLSATPTVGLDRPVACASSGRETLPRRKSSARTALSFITRNTLVVLAVPVVCTDPGCHSHLERSFINFVKVLAKALPGGATCWLSPRKVTP
jgi:hypothetical protein